MTKFKRLLSIFLCILPVSLFVFLVACSGPEPTPSGDILAPLPTNSDGSRVENANGANGAGNSSSESSTLAPNNADLPTILELLSEDPNLVFFMNGLNNVGLTDELQNGGPFTVFAASNLAFTRSQLVVSQMDPAVLGPVLDNHLVEGAFMKPALTAAGSVVTLANAQLPVIESEGQLVVDYALVEGEPIQASNGVIYVINTLLLAPETGPEKSVWGILESDGRFTIFVSILEGTEFMSDLRFKEAYDAVLAPTDEAFANMPANVVSYLENHPHDYQYVASFHLLKPDGWPQGTDLMLADMVELGEISTSLSIGGSGFGLGFEKLNVVQTENGVQINSANVLTGDMDAVNGVVHAIDAVLVPQGVLEHIEN